jgi:hypothetical protein
MRVMPTLPDFLVIGGRRCGSTLLHNILSAHSEVYVPTRRKEVHYFDQHFERGVDWYLEFFPNGSQSVSYSAIGEVTPDYLAHPLVPERIGQLLPDCRIVVVLRNPVDRTLSAWRYAYRSYNEQRSFADYVEQEPSAVGDSLYHRHLSVYTARFKAVHVMIYEELVQDPRAQLARLADFLDLSHSWSEPETLLGARVNSGDPPRFRRGFAFARSVGKWLMRQDIDWPSRLAKRAGIPNLFGKCNKKDVMPGKVRERLSEIFAPEVRGVEELLGRRLDVWRARI